MLGKQPIYCDSELRVMKRKEKMSLELKYIYSDCKGVKYFPGGEENTIKETAYCMLASSLKSLAPEHSITELVLNNRYHSTKNKD